MGSVWLEVECARCKTANLPLDANPKDTSELEASPEMPSCGAPADDRPHLRIGTVRRGPVLALPSVLCQEG